MSRKLITIERVDDVPLYATLDLPPGRVRAYALFVHCFSSLGSDADRIIATELGCHSIGVLSLDITGTVNHSDIAEQSPISIADLEIACKYLTSHYFMPQLFIGHSLGCFAMLALLNSVKDSRAVVSLSTPTRDEFEGLQPIKDLLKGSHCMINIENVKLRINGDLIRQTNTTSMADRFKMCDKHVPMLLLHSNKDKVFEYHKMESIFQDIKQPKSLVTIDNADHQLSSTKAATFSASIIANWSSHYLFTNSVEAIFDQGSSKNDYDTIVVSETGKHTYQQKVSLGSHHVFTDRAVNQGGSDTGPESLQLLLAALGSSTSIAIREHAQIKGWPLDHITIELRLVKNTHSPRAAIPSREYIMLEMHLAGNLDNIQRNSLVEVAKKCALRQYLGTKILIRLNGSDT